MNFVIDLRKSECLFYRAHLQKLITQKKSRKEIKGDARLGVSFLFNSNNEM